MYLILYSCDSVLGPPVQFIKIFDIWGRLKHSNPLLGIISLLVGAVLFQKFDICLHDQKDLFLLVFFFSVSIIHIILHVSEAI